MNILPRVFTSIASAATTVLIAAASLAQPVIDDINRNDTLLKITVSDQQCQFTDGSNQCPTGAGPNRRFWFKDGVYWPELDNQTQISISSGDTSTWAVYVYPADGFQPSSNYSVASVNYLNQKDIWNRAPQVADTAGFPEARIPPDGNQNYCMAIAVLTSDPTFSWATPIWKGGGTPFTIETVPNCAHWSAQPGSCFEFKVTLSNPSGKSNSATFICISGNNCTTQTCPGGETWTTNQ